MAQKEYDIAGGGAGNSSFPCYPPACENARGRAGQTHLEIYIPPKPDAARHGARLARVPRCDQPVDGWCPHHCLGLLEGCATAHVEDCPKRARRREPGTRTARCGWTSSADDRKESLATVRDEAPSARNDGVWQAPMTEELKCVCPGTRIGLTCSVRNGTVQRIPGIGGASAASKLYRELLLTRCEASLYDGNSDGDQEENGRRASL